MCQCASGISVPLQISDKANTLSEALDSMEVKASEPVVVPFTTT